MVETIEKITTICKSEKDWEWETFRDLHSFQTDTVLLKCRRWINNDTKHFRPTKLGLILRIPIEKLNAIARDPDAVQQIARQMVTNARAIEEGCAYPEATLRARHIYEVAIND